MTRDINGKPISDLECEGRAQGPIGKCGTLASEGAAISGGAALQITDEEAMILILALLAL